MAQEAVRESAAERELRLLDEAGVLEQRGLWAEIIAGELVIRGAPRWRHQELVVRIASWLHAWAEEHGGHVAYGPGVQLDPENSVRPDVVFVRADRAHLIQEDGLYVGPDLVVEVLSPGTRSLDLVEKRAIYERLRAPEYWVVERDAGQVLVYRLEDRAYAPPQTLSWDATLEPAAAPGLRATVAELIGRPRA